MADEAEATDFEAWYQRMAARFLIPPELLEGNESHQEEARSALRCLRDPQWRRMHHELPWFLFAAPRLEKMALAQTYQDHLDNELYTEWRRFFDEAEPDFRVRMYIEALFSLASTFYARDAWRQTAYNVPFDFVVVLTTDTEVKHRLVHFNWNPFPQPVPYSTVMYMMRKLFLTSREDCIPPIQGSLPDAVMRRPTSAENRTIVARRREDILQYMNDHQMVLPPFQRWSMDMSILQVEVAVLNKWLQLYRIYHEARSAFMRGRHAKASVLSILTPDAMKYIADHCDRINAFMQPPQ